jgi:hypothetical protein
MRFFAPMLAGAVLLAALGVGATHAATARPVHVHGAGLRSLFTSFTPPIDPDRDQFDGGLLRIRPYLGGFLGPPTRRFSMLVEVVLAEPDVELGVYSGHESAPELHPVLPAGSAPQTLASILLDTSRQVTRVVTFAPLTGVVLQIREYALVDTFGVGLYIRSSRGTFFSQDARNPGSNPHVLFFRDPIDQASLLIAWEDAPTANADDDFDDIVLYVANPSEGPHAVPTRKASWATLKARFR